MTVHFARSQRVAVIGEEKTEIPVLDTIGADRETLDIKKVAAMLGESAAALIDIISRRAQDENLPLYLAGGVIRDLLLGRRNLDLDFVVEGDAAAFAKALAVEFGGLAHIHPPFGTAKWELGAMTAAKIEQLPDWAEAGIDFASAREESYELPAALPQVAPSTIERDLGRRDFSINALALQLSPASARGRIVDPHGGRDDLERGFIRVLHAGSFIDDPTRIFRALRLASRLNFEIEPQTTGLLREALPTIARLSGERIRNELKLILREAEPERAIRDMRACGAFAAIQNAWQISDRLPEYFALCRQSRPPWLTEGYNKIALRWHLLMADMTEDSVNAVCARLTLGRELTRSVAAFARISMRSDMLLDRSLRPSQVSKLLDGAPGLALHALWICGFDLPLARRRIEAFVGSWRDARPKTDGKDLIKLGLQPGPCFREIIETLRDAWIDGDIQSEQEERNLLGDLVKSLAD